MEGLRGGESSKNRRSGRTVLPDSAFGVNSQNAGRVQASFFFPPSSLHMHMDKIMSRIDTLLHLSLFHPLHFIFPTRTTTRERKKKKKNISIIARSRERAEVCTLPRVRAAAATRMTTLWPSTAATKNASKLMIALMDVAVAAADASKGVAADVVDLDDGGEEGEPLKMTTSRPPAPTPSAETPRSAPAGHAAVAARAPPPPQPLGMRSEKSKRTAQEKDRQVDGCEREFEGDAHAVF